MVVPLLRYLLILLIPRLCQLMGLRPYLCHQGTSHDQDCMRPQWFRFETWCVICGRSLALSVEWRLVSALEWLWLALVSWYFGFVPVVAGIVICFSCSFIPSVSVVSTSRQVAPFLFSLFRAEMWWCFCWDSIDENWKTWWWPYADICWSCWAQRLY